MSNTANQTPVPRSLKTDGDVLIIEWDDNVTHRLPWRLLRDACPCATCRGERSQPPQPADLLPVITPAEAQPLAAIGMKQVGNYAYGIDFSDGHNTGIYSLDFLRSLGEQLADSQQ